MRDESSKKSKLSWSKSLIKKWFNIKGKAQDFHSDDIVGRVGDRDWRNSISERKASTAKKKNAERMSKSNMDKVGRGKIDCDASQVTDTQEYRIFVATWNVGGKSPPKHMNIEDWLQASPPADIYVLGFQEIVPLNAGNVLGTEDNGPAKKWLALIRRTLNKLPGSSGNGSNHTPSPVPIPVVELDDDFEGSSSARQRNSSFFHHRFSFQSLNRSMRMNDDDILVPQPRLERCYSACERVTYGSRPSDFGPNFRWGGSSDDENITEGSPSTVFFSPMSYGYSGPTSKVERARLSGLSRYCLVASKQMVGIFLTIWVRREIKDDVKNMKVSCVGRGLMGYLGNKPFELWAEGRRRIAKKL